MVCADLGTAEGGVVAADQAGAVACADMAARVAGRFAVALAIALAATDLGADAALAEAGTNCAAGAVIAAVLLTVVFACCQRDSVFGGQYGVAVCADRATTHAQITLVGVTAGDQRQIATRMKA